MGNQYVVIGCGNAGFNAALKIRGLDKSASITMISDEDFPPYCRCLLTYFIEEKVDEKFLFQNNRDIILKNNINFLKNKRVVYLDEKEKKIILDDESSVSFDKLLMATGGKPVKPTFDFPENAKVFTLRKFEDALRINSSFTKGDTVVFEGGGLVSLKTLLALFTKGIKPVWIVKSSRILSFVSDEECATLIENMLSKKGVEIFKGEFVTEVDKEESDLIITTDKGRRIKAAGIIVGKGVAPEKLEANGNLGFSQGYEVNEYLETSISNVYAAGDCIICNDLSFGGKRRIPLWPLAGEQGIIAGKNMVLGNRVKYGGSIPVNSFSVFNNFFIAGGKKKIEDNEKDDFYEIVSVSGKNFKKLYFEKKTGRLKGYFLMNDIQKAGKYYYEIINGTLR